MSYRDRIRKVRSDMSKSFIKLAYIVLDEYVRTAFMTATEQAITDLSASIAPKSG